MIDETQQGATLGSVEPAPSQSDEGGGLHSEASSFWSQNSDYLNSLRGPQVEHTLQNGSADYDQAEFEEYRRWKAAKEGRDPRAVLEMAGFQPRDALDVMMFGQGQQEAPKPDPIEDIRSDLNQLRTELESDRTERQTVQAKIRESKVKSSFVENVRSMQDLTHLNAWGDEAINTAWSVFSAATKEAAKSGRQPPSPRETAIEVEKYLRSQAERLRNLEGASADQLGSSVNAPSHGTRTEPMVGTAQTQPGMSPTLTNVGGNTGARPSGPMTIEELRARALEAAKAFQR